MTTSLVLLLLAMLVESVKGKEICSSSCGRIQNIGYPFRLKGDPAYCGDPNYQLTCKNNTPFIDISSTRFLVKSISYEDYSTDYYSTVGTVGVGALSGNCSHFKYMSAVYENSDYFQTGYYTNWATFVKCSKVIHNDTYRPIPCLSSQKRFVYVTTGYKVGDVYPFCSFLSTIPTSVDITSLDVDVFKVLQQGFSVIFRTNQRNTMLMITRACLQQSTKYYYPWNEWKNHTILTWIIYPFKLEGSVLDCYSIRGYPYVQRLVLVFVIVIDIIAIISVILLLVRIILAPLTMYLFLAHNTWKLLVPTDDIEKFLRKLEALTPTRYSYTDITAMTNHFKEKLGKGGFGSVFKGELPGGFLVAIKILSNSKGDGDDFISEVSTIGSIHHHNVVRLVGFCSEGLKRALVYEFMPRGSLDKYIFSSNGTSFTKKKLNEIALGVARGIDYLHRGCEMRILHFDIKPHNILLDNNFNPKVSDFGLAKLYPKEYNLVSTFAARGTIGYMAPELVSRTFGQISYKSDVYSFGMLLMEMAGGRRNVDSRVENSSQVYYPSWIYDRIHERESLQIATSNEIEIDDIETKLSKVGLWCIQMRSSDRPDMSRVIEMLEAETYTLQLPPKPFSFSSIPASLRESCINTCTTELSTISETSDPPSLH